VNSAVKKQFKTQAHTLKPIVTIGQAGLTDAVLVELNIALDTHELLKIKIRLERDTRKQISTELCEKTQAELIQRIGQTVVIYRKSRIDKSAVKKNKKRVKTNLRRQG